MGRSLNMPQDTPVLTDTHISLAHGNGGRYMRELIDGVFARFLATSAASDEPMDTEADAVLLKDIKGPIFTTVDGFAVHPIEFPGGNIGSLAVHGTVNDLSVAGAIPRYLTLSAILEEGLEIEVLERAVASLAKAASEANVRVVAGDTKVVPRGHGGGIYFSISGIGEIDPGLDLSMQNIQPGDKVIVSGTVGDHGAAVMLAREEFGLHGEVQSDCGSVLPLTSSLSGIEGVHFLRDPTRGGLATVTHEMARVTGHRMRLKEEAIPVNDAVSSICEILGYDPLYLACEGRCVAVVSADIADRVVQVWRDIEAGKGATIVGEVEEGHGDVLLQTPIGGERRLEELEDDP
ncbi:MAG: hydrogenase expression/formation protein HypE, partial [Gammaproteobacteria bacterium]|nr:hydrogenase expression/formation protein HypE [Gammaproteobacteria bacterium]